MAVFHDAVQIAVHWIVVVRNIAGKAKFVMNIIDQGGDGDSIAFSERLEAMCVIIEFAQVVFDGEIVFSFSCDRS